VEQKYPPIGTWSLEFRAHCHLQGRHYQEVLGL
jgi:hypothetical protein